MGITKMKALLDSTARIVKHHKQLTEARGEYYNMFSVLKIGTRENNTHSAFLVDLLNPKGAHRRGAIFLELFKGILNEVNDGKNKKPFEYSKRTQVRPEKGIGDIDIEKQTGGRIDIFLEDVKGNTISIENKIHAPEQKLQVARYCNYQTDTNTVYYLTLNGEEPSEYSRGDKKEGSDFYLLSYKEDISNWLQLCLKEVPNFTALRETINQYILLIKKLTFTMNNEQQKELSGIMLENLEESKYIAENYERFVSRLRDQFRKTLKHELSESLDNIMYSVELGDDIHCKFSQIWIACKSPIEGQKDVSFGVESFSGRGNQNGNLFVGLFNDDKSKIGDKLEDKNVINKWWRQTEPLVSEDNNPVNLANFYWLKVISKPESKEYKELLDNSKKLILNFVKSFEG
jgi:hypothetical protein